MSAAQDTPVDLSVLSDRYEIVGEYAAAGPNRRYPARRREDGRDVLISVLHAAPDVSQGKAIAQFAADANLMTSLSHPNVPQVLEGRWLAENTFALVTDRIQGATMAELLTGDRLPPPRIADILADVDGVLEWARGERLSHRAVTPDGVWVERGTNRVFVTLSPTDAPKTNRPDDRDDARTIGTLAMAMLAAKPMAEDHDGTLTQMRPDLPQRVVDATEKLAACTINDDSPDISAYLGSLAMAEPIKEGEVEVARVEAEFRAQMQAEREQWEAEQHARQVANDAQAKQFAEERAEYERRSAKERAQLAAARVEVDQRRAEVQRARVELDQARAVYKRKKFQVETRAKVVDRHMSALEKQKRSLERRAAELEQRHLELQQFAALAAAGSADDIAQRPTMELQAVEEDADDIPVMLDVIEAEDDVQAWTSIGTDEPWAVPLETEEPSRAIQYQAAAVPEPPKRGKGLGWMGPAIVAGAGLVAGLGWVARNPGGATTALATFQTPAVVTTAPGLLTDSAAGTVAAMSDSVVFNAIRDSIIAADEARRIRRERAGAVAEEERRRAAALTYTDSAGTVWYVMPPDSLDRIRRADSVAKARRDSIARVKPDTILKAKPDTGKS